MLKLEKDVVAQGARMDFQLCEFLAPFGVGWI